MAGWEGATYDTRIFLDAIRHPKYKFPYPLNNILKGKVILDHIEDCNIIYLNFVEVDLYLVKKRAYENITDPEDVHDGESDDGDDVESNNLGGYEME
ncbi:hypothetical protein PVK06_002885 [Gossypium arboreum]|uniref:Uncharacterized protein n=1 Tax=Gossypium arboreum TaxID=29729 RepID=A0ABR0R643_GOSAR|nr:hypothetical protein PVK06_002885 [Gossypium arboreum]